MINYLPFENGRMIFSMHKTFQSLSELEKYVERLRVIGMKKHPKILEIIGYKK